MKKLIFLAFLAIISSSLAAQLSAVHHYLPVLSAEQARSYKGYDFIIPDHEVIFNSPENLKLMRKDNPGLQILVYANKIEWHEPMFSDKPWSLKMVAELQKYPKWFLRDLLGYKLEFWPGTVLMNCRLDCPRYIINGKSYSYIEYFTENYIKEVIGAYRKAGIRLDGLLDDELLKSISFITHYGKNRNNVDGDGDGLNDDPNEFNRQWRLGNAYFLNKVREAMGPDFVIIGNGGHGYYLDYCNGKMFEYFPEVYLNETDQLTEAWPENMNHAAGMEIAIFNARANAYGKKDNWLFTLCSAMMLDQVIFSHGQNMPYDEKYNLHLGKALGNHYQVGNVVSRKFAKGIVHVDPVAKKAWIER
ncbi:MAG: putative glycoside hydrolase [Candidatus Falkowbacteria bacterium]